MSRDRIGDEALSRALNLGRFRCRGRARQLADLVDVFLAVLVRAAPVASELIDRMAWAEGLTRGNDRITLFVAQRPGGRP